MARPSWMGHSNIAGIAGRQPVLTPILQADPKSHAVGTIFDPFLFFK
jgi:hypothetical protein